MKETYSIKIESAKKQKKIPTAKATKCSIVSFTLWREEAEAAMAKICCARAGFHVGTIIILVPVRDNERPELAFVA